MRHRLGSGMINTGLYYLFCYFAIKQVQYLSMSPEDPLNIIGIRTKGRILLTFSFSMMKTDTASETELSSIIP